MSTINLNKIYNLDCLELFKQMKTKGIMVDAIITDPPFIGSEINPEYFAKAQVRIKAETSILSHEKENY